MAVDHDVLMSLKVAMLEQLMTNLLAGGFEQQPAPIRAVERFADDYRKLWESRRGSDPELDLQIAEVWNQFLDDLVAEVRRRTTHQKP